MRPVQILENTLSLASGLISLSGVVVMIFAASPTIIAVMALAAVPAFIVRFIKARKIYEFRKEKTPLDRRSYYYSRVLTDEHYALEVRALNLGPKFNALYSGIRATIVKFVTRISRRMALMDIGSTIVETAAIFLVTAMLISRVGDGAITIGSFVMLFEAFRRGMTFLQNVVRSFGVLYNNKLFISNLFEFLELKPTVVSPADPVPFPENVESVEFRDLSFTYPGGERPVFEGYNLLCRKGESSRINGENGFGKTTLVKLLLRLYDPSHGTILINGIDIRRFDLVDLRRHVNAVFQDFVRYFLSFGENITLGDVFSEPDSSRLEKAVRLAGLQKVEAKLPKGYDTQMGRVFGEGVELSMGQKQRMAIARGLYADAPVMVLDEPLAWMDAASRDDFMKMLDNLSKEKVVILITHL